MFKSSCCARDGETAVFPSDLESFRIKAAMGLLLAIALTWCGSGCTGFTSAGASSARAGVPFISTQPSSKTVTVGQTASFTVVTTGGAPLSYQWERNGVVISGATSIHYTTPPTTSSDNGSIYQVVVSNSLGAATSKAVTLTVTSNPLAPRITMQPGNQTVSVGQTGRFTVVASGNAPLSYQWHRNGTAIRGATSASYTTPPTTNADSGSSYQVVVSNFGGAATSDTATLTVTSNAVPPPSTPALLGIVYGKDGWAMPEVRSMEAWQGKKFAALELFSSWCPGNTEEMDNLFNVQLPDIWQNGNVPVLTWQPLICSSSGTPSDVDFRISAGDYDSYIDQFADRLKSFLSGPDGVFGTSDDRRIYIRFGHEMNGNWYPWSATVSGQSPVQFVDMWRHVHSIFDAKGIDASHVQWVWCVNSKDASSLYTAEQYYPGNAYVDWIGIDGYNYGDQTFGATSFQWQTPDQVLSPMLTRMRTLASKPIGLMETASSAATSSGVNRSAKDRWIQQLYAYVLQQGFGMVIWFDNAAPLGGTSCCRIADWPVFGGSLGDDSYNAAAATYLVFSAYRPTVAAAALTSSDPTNLRLLSDDLFLGH
jgi:mannan endo-1,4-beta-mannosidase